MIHFSIRASLLRSLAAVLSGLVAVLGFASAANAVTLDFNVPSGNFTTPGNWVDSTNPIPAPTSATPTVADQAFVRNGGTVTINSNVQMLQMRIGHENVVTNPDYDSSGTVDAGDYVLWRKGGPLANDATPDTVGPDDYSWWRYRFGGTPLQQEIGLPGTVNWTAGEITGPYPDPDTPSDIYSGGPDIRVGRVRTTNSAVDEITGTVVQNGATTKLLLPYRQSMLTIGDGTAGTHTPTSSYTLANGTIGLAIGSNNLGTRGTNDNDGILVRNGTFTMTGGQIIDVTPADYSTVGLTAQRFLTIGTASGSGPGDEAVATATFSGGTVNVLGGIRVATANNSRGYLNINGPVTIVTGGDTSIGYEPTGTGHTNAVGEMNMSAGSFQVGRTDIDPNTGSAYPLAGRLQIGNRGKGILNMSGGSISVTTDIRVAAEQAAGGSAINMTGGTITTPALDIRNKTGSVAELGGSVILDGPSAVFTQSGSGGAIIGNNGMGLFEVRQGTATLGGGGSSIQLGATANSAATINVKGGKLTLGGPVNRSNLSSTAPVIGLTGGIVEFNNTVSSAAQSFHANLTLDTGSTTKLITKAGALQQVNVGSSSPAIPANFDMKSGSWDLEIGAHTALGADWFNAANGTASLTGGTLNISYLSGFTPNPNEAFTILKGSAGVTLNSAAVTIAGSGAGNWVLQTSGATDIQLKYVGPGAGAGGGLGTASVPEPSSVALVVLAAIGVLGGKRTRLQPSV
jgi:hypothetical protein